MKMNENYEYRDYVEDSRDKIYCEFVELSLYFNELMDEVENHTKYETEEWETISELHEKAIKSLLKLEARITSL